MSQKHFQYVVCLNMEDIKDKMIEDQKFFLLSYYIKKSLTNVYERTDIISVSHFPLHI